MNKKLFRKVISLPKFKVDLEDIQLPKDGIQKDLWDFFNSVNFVTPMEFWSTTHSDYLTEHPIYVSKLSGNDFKIIAGFRVFQIAKLLGYESVFAIDVSDFNPDEQNDTAIHFTIFSILLWGVKSKNIEVDLKKFMKSLSKLHPMAKKTMVDYKDYCKSISRFRGREQVKSVSKLSVLVNNHRKNDE